VDGVRYHHLIDPRTGYPAREARSFTVVIPDGTSADAASTAGFVLGPEAGLEFVVRLGGQAVAMDASGRWVESPSLGTLEG
jgi:thiamine biosynthesis lipoprotein